MLRIVPIPETGYKAIWDTVQDAFFQDANGDQGWESVDDIACSYLDEMARMEFLERVSLLWGNA